MAKLTKNEKYIVEMYVRYFGKAPTDAQIADYADLGKPKLILAQIRGEADDAKTGMSSEEFVNSIFQNLFGRDASTKELNKYSKMVDNGKDLPINAIVKNAKPSDKKVYQTKKAVAELVATEGSTTNYDLDKITKDTYADIYNPKTKKLLVDTVAELDAEVEAMPDNVTGQTFTLTTGVDTLDGTEKGDVFNAYDFVSQFTGIVTSTLNNFDTLDGKDGNDTLNIITEKEIGDIVNPAVGSPVLNLTSIETVNVTSSNNVELDGTEWNGTTALNVIKAKNVGLTAADTTDVNVSGTTGTVAVDGGKNVVVNDATANKAITIGATTGAAGTITVTDTKQGTGVIAVDGGTDVTITATAAEDGVLTTTGAIKIGQDGTAILPTGDVKVTQNLEFDGNVAGAAGTNLNGGAITISGGKTVDVTVNANNVAKVATAANNIVVGTITVKGGDNTTTVTVTQNDNSEKFTSAKVAEVKESTTITFKDVTAGETVTLASGTTLTFKASKDLTAAEVAAAFANLSADDYQTSGGKVANGTFSGQFSSAWTSASANGADVVFTAISNNETDITIGGSAANTATQVQVNGTPTSGGATSSNAVTYGQVVINNTAKTTGTTDTIKTVTVDGYATSSSVASDALTTLTLKNSAGTMNVDVNAANTFTLNVDNVNHAVSLDAVSGADIKTLTINTTGEDSDFALTAAAVETLTIAAAADLDLASSTLTAVKTVTITGAGDVNLGDLSASNSASFATLNASAATGNITAEITATNTAVTTGSGNDTITATVGAVGTAISKAIDLGAGDDTLVLFAGTTAVPTAAVKGGDGVDTISMTFASAASYDDAELFKNAISGFERLEINNVVTSAQTIDLANLGFTSYVTTSGTSGATYTGVAAAATDAETFTFVYNGTSYTATLNDAGDGTGTLTVEDYQNAIDAAVTAGTATPLGGGKVTATLTTDLVLTAAAAGDTVTAGSYNDANGTPAIIDGKTTTLKLNKLAANATVVLTADGSVEAVLATATGTADVINVIIDANDTTINAGTFTVNDVENVNITAEGVFTDDGKAGGSTKDDGKDDAIDVASLTLNADKVKTITIDGYADLNLDTNSGLASSVLTKVDASAMTGDLVYTADGATAGTEVIGGAGNDILIASGEKDVLKGGAGNDTFYAEYLTTVYGGAGADKFYFATPTQLSKVSTIADLGSGDTIYLIDNEDTFAVVGKFYSAGAEYNANTTTTFEAKVDASLSQTGAGESTWFQHAGNTYIVIDNKAGGDPLAGAVDTYTAGKDIVIEIIGLKDLSTASFNADIGTLEIA